MTTTRAHTSIAAFATLLMAACATPPTDGGPPDLVITDTTAVAEPSSEGESSSDGEPTTTTAGSPTTVRDEPAERPFPAAALPIRQRFVFDAPAGSPYGFDDELVVWHGTSEIARVDVDSGAISTASLVADDQLRAETFYAISTGDEYVIVADVVGQGVLDSMVTVDPHTLEILGRSPSGQRATVSFASGPEPRVIVAWSGADLTMFDVAAASTGDVIASNFPGNVHWNRDQFWTWTATGEVTVRDPEFVPLATIDLGFELDIFDFSPALVTADWFWFADSARGVLLGVDRTTYEVTHRVDLSDHFEWAAAVRVRASDPDAGFVIANVIDGEDGWWILVGVDPATGEVTSEHVISTDSFEHGWNAFEAPAVASIGDRVFVRDHLRSIVEVDTEALRDEPGAPWTDAGLGRAATLDAVEQEVADATQKFLAGDVTLFDDEEMATVALDALTPLVGGFDAWEVYSAEVVGDRAWSRATPVGESVGGFFVWERIDGDWHLVADGLCAVAFNALCDEASTTAGS